MATPTMLAGSEPGLGTGRTRTGDLPDDLAFGITVRVRRRRKFNRALLTETDSIETFGRATFTDLFGAAQADLDAVGTFAAAHGLAVTGADRATRCVALHGMAGCYAAAFATRLGRYDGPGGAARSHDGGIQLPPALSAIVQSVLGLDDRRAIHSCIRRGRLAPPGGTAFLPGDLAAAYRLPPDSDGTGQRIGLIGFAAAAPQADLDAFCALLGIPKPVLRIVPVETDTLAPEIPPTREHARDRDALAAMLELLAALAPRAELVLRLSAPTERGCIDALAQAVHGADPALDVLCLGWAGPEEGWSVQAALAIDDLLADAAALGITVCAASGDDGAGSAPSSDQAAVSLPASSPFALACGGTALRLSAGGIPCEAVWNDVAPGFGSGGLAEGGGASGGGISTLFAVPPWQLPHDPPLSVRDAAAGRGVPDVAAAAAPFPGLLCVLDGAAVACGGTAIPAALWAALVARINQSAGGALGFLTPRLYALARTGAFNDIRVGDIETTGRVGGYFARPGWDACTGLGTPQGDGVLRGLVYFADAGPGPRATGDLAFNWQPLPGFAHDIAAGPDGTLWALGIAAAGVERPLYRSSPAGWLAVPGAAGSALAVARDGTPWLADAAGGIRAWNGTHWQEHPGRARSLAFAADGTLWIVARADDGSDGESQDEAVQRWTGSAFVPAGATARHVRATRSGPPLLVTGAGDALRLHGTDWIRVAKNAADIAADADGQIWAVSRTGGRIWRRDERDATWLGVADAVAERLVPLHAGGILDGMLAIQRGGRLFIGRAA